MVHWERTVRTLFVVAVTIELLVAGALLVFARPIADDFVRQYDGITRGWWGVVTDNYLHWCGRWASMGLEGLLMPRVMKFPAYSVSLATLAAVQLTAFYAFVHLLLADAVRFGGRVGLALGLWAIHWAGTPEPGQSAYWLTGGIENQLSLSLALILVCLVARIQPRSPVRRALWLIVGSLTAIFITGMHELVGVMLTVALAIGSFVSYRWQTRNRRVWWTLLIVSATGLLITIAAPGNAIRTGHFDHSGQIAKSIGLTARFMLRDVPVWAADPKLLGASLFLFLSPWFAGLSPAWLRRSDVRWVLLIPGATLLCITAGAAATAWGTGSSPPGRSQAPMHVLFLLGGFGTLLVGTRWPDNWITRREPPARFLQYAGLFVAAVALLGIGNTNLALRDFDKRVRPWHRAMQERERLLRTATPRSELVVPRVPRFPDSYFDNDITEDPAAWQNQALARSYHLASVRLESPAEEWLRRSNAQSSPNRLAGEPTDHSP